MQEQRPESRHKCPICHAPPYQPCHSGTETMWLLHNRRKK